MKDGDLVRITYKGGQRGAKILIASPNGRSLLLQFDGALGGHVGMMPVLQGRDGVYRSILDEERVDVVLA